LPRDEGYRALGAGDRRGLRLAAAPGLQVIAETEAKILLFGLA